MTELEARRGDLETFLQVARGRVAAARDKLADEEAGYAQIEGRLMELTEIIQSMRGTENGDQHLSDSGDPGSPETGS